MKYCIINRRKNIYLGVYSFLSWLCTILPSELMILKRCWPLHFPGPPVAPVTSAPPAPSGGNVERSAGDTGGNCDLERLLLKKEYLVKKARLEEEYLAKKTALEEEFLSKEIEIIKKYLK